MKTVADLAREHPTLSIRQPWAWCIIHADKDIENRSWRYPPKYRGPLLIHAGKQWDPDTTAIDICEEYQVDCPDHLPLGGIVGIVDLVDVVTDTRKRKALDNPATRRHLTIRRGQSPRPMPQGANTP